ncbi:MAG: acireductone synthase [Gammaproteobacteria bacterium]|nr:acireductone synthase [Gammaproteobacteria bacterium]
MNIKAIVTDIEGTTSSIDFVHKELFPYASKQLPAYIREHQDDTGVATQLQAVRELINKPDADIETLIATLLQWIKDDNKATPLKALQGMIWEHGYRAGAFTGHMYDEVAPKLKKWFDSGIALYVYSSGSVAAQKLLFGHSDVGDLTPLFSGYFDTNIGHKREAQSYQNIVEQLALPAENILFLSDIVEELDAAAQTGMCTMQLVRKPNVITGNHATAHNFDEIHFNTA